MKSLSRRVRIALAIVVAIYLGYSAFGIAAPFYWGHHGYHGATYMLRARTSLRQHMIAPATWTGFDRPVSEALYFHHPIGYHHLLTLTVPIFGDKEWLPRALAALGGLATLFALFQLVRRYWSPWLALASVAVYVALPIITTFSVLSDPMLLEMACVLWALRAYFDYLQRPSRTLLIEAALAYAIGGLLMWEVFFIGPFVALHTLLYNRTTRGKILRDAAWQGAPLRLLGLHPTTIHTLVIGSACVAVMAFHIGFTKHAGVWGEFIASYQQRHAAPSGAYVLDRHTQWMMLLYGPVPLVVAAIWYLVFLARSAMGRARLRDLAPLTFLYTNILYICLFAEGSSVHMYRVFFFSGFFALCTIDLVDDIARFARRIARSREVGIACGVFALAAYFIAEVPLAFASLLESRVLMGTLGEARYSPHDDQYAFAKEATRFTATTDRVILHYPSMTARKELWYYLDRSLDEVTNMNQVERYRKTFDHSILVYDDRAISPPERAVAEALMKDHPVRFYDRFVLIDLRVTGARIEGWDFDKGAMSPGYRFWVSHVYPPLRPVRRASATGVCTGVRLSLPIAIDEQPLRSDSGQGCLKRYAELRAHTEGDTIPPQPQP